MLHEMRLSIEEKNSSTFDLLSFFKSIVEWKMDASSSPPPEYNKVETLITLNQLDANNSRSLLLNEEEPERNDGNVQFIGDMEDAPQGRHLGIFSIMILFISRILGSGIFATSSAVFESCGRSPFLFFLSWILSFVLAFSGLYVYLELGSLIPRSGGTKAFLEVIYDKPYMMSSVMFLIYSVMFGYSILSSLVFGEYLLRTFDIEVTEIKSRLVGLSFVYFAGLVHGVSTNHGVMVQNVLGGLKIMLLFVMVFTGIYVICFPKSITGLENHLHWDSFFEIKTSTSVSGMSNAILMCSFTLSGWNMGHASSNEVKDPLRTFSIAGPLSLIIITLGYAAINLCYISVIPEKEFAESGSLVGSILFEKVFGEHIGRRFLTFSIAVCTAGNIFVVIYGISRVSQEVFREGFLPFSETMASNKPFGTPFACIALALFLSTVITLGAPKGGFYNFIISLEGYPIQVYTFLVAIGIFILRRKFPDTKASIRAGYFGTILTILVSFYLIIAPFIGKGNSNPKGTESWISYAVMSWILLLIGFLYWLFMFQIRPSISGYQLTPEVVEVEDGLKIKRWLKVSGRYFG